MGSLNPPLESSADQIDLWNTKNRSGILLTLNDEQGKLVEALQILHKFNINLTQIKSRPPKQIGDKRVMNFHLDFEGSFNEKRVREALYDLAKISEDLTELGTSTAPWFPLNLSDFDHIGKRILSEGDGIQDSDHPGFRDEAYRKRRDEISAIALNYSINDPIPAVKYTAKEIETWQFCYDRLRIMFKTNACKEFNDSINSFEKDIGLRNNDII